MAEVNDKTINNTKILSSSSFHSYQELIAESIKIAFSGGDIQTGGNIEFTGNETLKMNINKTDLGFDAWGRNKVVLDYSLFHGIFTFNIPPEMWVKYNNGVEDLTVQDTAAFYSENGKGVVSSAGGSSYLMSRRHPRYQPNRGHIYSASIFLPDVEALAIRRFGLFNQSDGAFFELKDGILYAVIRSTYDDFITSENSLKIYDEFGATIEGENSEAQEIRAPIDATGIDLAKGNIYDIQMQWRGVGDIKFFINQKLIYSFDFLGKLGQLSIGNPALPLAIEATNNGEDATIECGCCDVTSESGKKETRFYKTIDTGEYAISTTETPVLAFRLPEQYAGKMNTRNCALTRISGFSDANSLLKIYYTRHKTSITANWQSLDGGFQEYAINADITAFDTTNMKKLSTRRIPENGNVEVENPDKQAGDFYLIHGDLILVTITAKNNTLAGAMLEFSEEI